MRAVVGAVVPRKTAVFAANLMVFRYLLIRRLKVRFLPDVITYGDCVWSIFVRHLMTTQRLHSGSQQRKSLSAKSGLKLR